MALVEELASLFWLQSFIGFRGKYNTRVGVDFPSFVPIVCEEDGSTPLWEQRTRTVNFCMDSGYQLTSPPPLKRMMKALLGSVKVSLRRLFCFYFRSAIVDDE